MSTLTTINATDQITASRSVINNNFSALNTDKMELSYLDTDTTLAANSDVKVASQKATKAYVDAGGNVNASTTTKGIVEEATDAEIVAGTDTGGTGARLFVAPSKLNTQVNTLIAAALPFFQQDIALSRAETIAAGTEFATGSMTDGSAFFVNVIGGVSNYNLYRFERDSSTGQYIQTHNINPTITIPNTDNGAIINIGLYIYLFTNNGTNIVCSRFLAANLTGETVMTVPVVACTTVLGAWTDGTDAYIISDTTNETSRRWSVSGTTFTAESTATVADFVGTSEQGTMWDGTTAYWATMSESTFTIKKFTNIDASTLSTSTKTLPTMSDVDLGVFIIKIDTTKIYIGFMYAVYDETAQISARIMLMPITKP